VQLAWWRCLPTQDDGIALAEVGQREMPADFEYEND